LDGGRWTMDDGRRMEKGEDREMGLVPGNGVEEPGRAGVRSSRGSRRATRDLARMWIRTEVQRT